jgi:cysteinyl-tRNA synthetase
LALSDEGLRAAQASLDYLREFARNVPAEAVVTGDSEFAAGFRDQFVEALNDDLNTPRALAAAREMVAEANRRGDQKIWNTLEFFDRVLGLDLQKIRAAAQSTEFPAAVRKLIDERAAARRAKDFQRADRLRAQLEAQGYEVKDGRDGAATYRRRAK